MKMNGYVDEDLHDLLMDIIGEALGEGADPEDLLVIMQDTGALSPDDWEDEALRSFHEAFEEHDWPTPLLNEALSRVADAAKEDEED